MPITYSPKLGLWLPDATGDFAADEVREAVEQNASILDDAILDGDARMSPGAAGTATVRKLGTGATDATAGNDARLPTSTEKAILDSITFAAQFLDDPSAAAVLSTLGVSAFAQTLLDDPNAAGALTTLGVSTFMRGLLSAASAATARATLGVAATIRGVVAADGTITRGTGFSVVKSGTGSYAVTFTTAFAATPVVTLTPKTWSTTGVTGETTNGFSVTNWNVTDGSQVDGAFAFAALEA